jgi:beta-N-acetylhexosaminidase
MALKDSFRRWQRRRRRRRRHRALEPRRELRRGPVLVLAGVLVAALVAVVLVIVLSGGGGSPRPAALLPPASGSASTGPVSHRSFLERVIPPPAERSSGPSVPSSLGDLAQRLPLERKVAQLFIFGFDGKDSSSPVFDELAKLDMGGLSITSDNYIDPSQLKALTSAAGAVVKDHRLVPPWLLTVQDGAEFSELRDLPPDEAPSEIKTIGDATDAAAQTAVALRQVGVNGVLGPDVDVDTSTGGAYSRVSYSDSPAEEARFAAVTVRAFAREKMFVTPKHFPGLGAASQPTDDGPANVGLTPQQLGARDLVPFKAAFDAGASGVMLGHGLYSTDDFATPASQSTALATQLLRGNMRFDGVAVTDDLESPAITGSQAVPDAAVASIKAGADMVWISGPKEDQDAAYLAVLNAARRGEIPKARINEAVLRILQTKQQLGLISGG